MSNFEAPRFNLEPEPDEHQENIDLRNEAEVFRDHERMGDADFSDATLQAGRETLADEEDGIIYIKLPVYEYNQSTNPFLGMGPHTIKLYSISRHLDVTFLHRFIYGDILVQGLRSGDYVSKHQRKKFVKHIKETGGLPLNQISNQGYDFEALRFAPYVESDTTRPIFEKYHVDSQHAADRPHYPVDIWLVYDMNAYVQISPEANDKLATYQLDLDYDRQAALLAVAMIN